MTHEGESRSVQGTRPRISMRRTLYLALLTLLIWLPRPQVAWLLVTAWWVHCAAIMGCEDRRGYYVALAKGALGVGITVAGLIAVF